MTDNEEDCSGEIYGQKECRNEGEAGNCHTTNLRDEQCFIVKPSSKHVEDLPCKLSIYHLQNLQHQIKISR